MKTKTIARALLSALILFAVASPFRAQAAETARPAIYDESADGQKQLTTALEQAKKENKVILLQFGANWCGWCHKLFDTDQAIHSKLQKDYVVVMVDEVRRR